ncbi:uncharacterized protein KQ657_002249 [Scheffersomyces spartinae]|uniref:Uncharacterized protein n=1 Tax=Scheffersomyces spartinae TaxID=45513 RepID=A0A9P7VDL2_9ASCO|nr:uncharacterized protein KQ657_002249 [Scheffersomyces spartinae]KAG7195864.1 hypothetical protein KQ657_002249 [Scheffersomyces spartinae]
MTDPLIAEDNVSDDYEDVKKINTEIAMSDRANEIAASESGMGSSFGDSHDVSNIEPSIANPQHQHEHQQLHESEHPPQHGLDEDIDLQGDKEPVNDLVHVAEANEHDNAPGENEDPLLADTGDKGDINEAIIKSLLLTVHRSYMEAAAANSGVLEHHSPNSTTPKERNSHLDAYNAAHKPIANMFIPGHVLAKHNSRTKLTTDDIQLILFLIVQVKPFKYVGDRSLSQTKKWLIIQERFEQIKKKQFGTNKSVLVPTVRTLQRQLASAVTRGQERVSTSMSVSYIVNHTAKIIKDLDRYSSLSEMEFVLAALNLLSDKIKHGEYSNAPVEFSMVQPYSSLDTNGSILKRTTVPPSLLSSKIPSLSQYSKEGSTEISNGQQTSSQVSTLDAASVLASTAVQEVMNSVEPANRDVPVDIVSPELHGTQSSGVDEISLTKTLNDLNHFRHGVEDILVKISEGSDLEKYLVRAVPIIKNVLAHLEKFRDLHKREVERIEREAEQAIEAAREKRDILLLATKQTKLNQNQVNEQFVRRLLDVIPEDQEKIPDLVATLEEIANVCQQ